MKKTVLLTFCLLVACLVLSACHNVENTGGVDRRLALNTAEETIPLDTADETLPLDTADETEAVITEAPYLLVHGACPVNLNGRIETLDDSLSYKRWYLGTFGASNEPLPDAFQSLVFDEKTTEEAYLSAFREALVEALPEGNQPDRFSVTVRSEGFCDDGTGYGYGHFAPVDIMEGVSRINYTFKFFVTVAGLESNASIIIKVENYKIKTVELCDLSRFLCYQDLEIDISPITAFANEAIRGEWKEHEEAGKRTPEYEGAPDCSIRYVFDPRYRVAVSEDAIYLEIRTMVTRCIRFCGLGLGTCVHYIKLS